MDWMIIIGDSCLETLAWLAAMTAVFGLLVWLMPCNRGMFWWKNQQAAATDLLYWFIVPVVLRGVRTLFLAVGVAWLASGPNLGFSAVRAWPLWRQCLMILLTQDVLLYWAHRVFHTRLAWSFHAIHHSPTVLDWSSAARFHFVNNLVSFLLADVLILALGFSPAALLALIPFNILYSAMVHANLNWTFGPLRYLFASPVFHRWHHTTEGAGLDKNFAPTFPLLDVIFGTFYMPAGEIPQNFGIGEPDFPEDFWGQFLHPFKRTKRTPTPTAESVGPFSRSEAA